MNWHFASVVVVFALALTPQVSYAAFHSRLGGQAYYDDQLDITWATDANLIGFDTWDNHLVPLSTLTIDGVSGWRLPEMDVNNDGTVVECTVGLGQAGCKDNEYGHLHRYGAGTTWDAGISFGNPGPFTNISAFTYWSNTTVPTDNAWHFTFTNGSQSIAWQENVLGAWVVHNGDVGAVSLAGDLDGDGFVGINDLNIVLGNWNQNVPPANPMADPSGDNFVGIDDLNAVLGNWNAGTPPTQSAGVNTPEPATVAVVGLGVTGLLWGRK